MNDSRIADVARGVLAAVALAVAVIGVPVLLIAAVGWPLPRAVPSLADITDTFTGDRPLETATVWKILAVGAWFAWAQVAAATAVEVAGVVRGSVPRVVRGLSLGQGIAAPLVAAIVFAWPTPGPAQAATPPLQAAAAAPPPRQPQITPPPQATGDTMNRSPQAPAARPGTVEHVVQPRETLWGLAQRYLGDGNRVGELFDLNRGRPQPDGGTLTNPSEVRAGWVLLVPNTAEHDVAGDDEDLSQITVAPGDTLWDLAEEHLDDPFRYPEIFERNEGRTQPDGRALHDPDLILPGWQLDLPATDPTGGPPPSVGIPEPATTGPQAPTPPTSSTPSTTATDVPATATPAPPAVGAETPAPADSRDTPEDDRGGASVPIGLIGGGITTAGLLVLLNRRRRVQQRHRHRGERIPPVGPEEAATERSLRAGATPDTTARVDVAMRAAAGGLAGLGFPRVQHVVVDPEAVTILTSSELPAPPGFADVGTGQWRTAASPADLADLGRQAPAPAPTLVALGTIDAGSEVLVDLEGAGVITINGPVDAVQAHLRCLAIHAATSPWREEASVVLVGDTQGAAAMPDVTTSPDLDSPLDRIEAHVQRINNDLAAGGWATTAEARIAVGPEGWEPTVLITTTAPDPAQQRRLAALALDAGHGFAIVTPVGNAPAGHEWTIDADGRITGDWLPTGLRGRLLASEELASVERLIARANEPNVPAADIEIPESRPVPLPFDEAPHDTPNDLVPAPATLADLLGEVDVVVQVLGSVGLVRPDTGESVTVSKQKALEAITYLALRETRVDRDELQAALWPDGRNSAKTLHNTLWVARRSLGEGREQAVLLPDPIEGSYQLDDRVVTDYGLFHELAARAEELEDAEAADAHLADALTLVHGEPFTGAGRSYSWVAPHAGTIVAEIIDAAEELAEVRLAVGDWRGAEWAARQGLRAFPCEERLYRILMRCAEASGSIPAVQRIYDELTAALADPDDGVEPDDTVHPETIALLDALTGATRRDKATA